MLKLDLSNKPAWLDLSHGVRVLLGPLTTAMMVAARGDPEVQALPEDAPIDQTALTFAKALARNAVTDWQGVGDADGNVIAVSPEAIDALLDVWPLFETFQTDYVAKGLVLDQEKNVSSPLPTGSSAGVGTTAKVVEKSARKSAKIARKKSTRRKQ
jgi:hypothetical protein